MLGTVYMNDPARMATSFRVASYPVGSVIVREKLLTPSDTIAQLLSVMIKREKGFNSKANDWEFLVATGDASKFRKREKTGKCLNCHASQKDQDFVFRNYQ